MGRGRIELPQSKTRVLQTLGLTTCPTDPRSLRRPGGEAGAGERRLVCQFPGERADVQEAPDLVDEGLDPNRLGEEPVAAGVHRRLDVAG